MSTVENAFYDVYILKNSGIKLLGGCTGSSYCKSHAENHDLHTGFLAAIQSFANETFTSSKLQSILFDDLQLNMKFDNVSGLIFAFIHPISVNREVIKQQIDKASKKFLEKYQSELNESHINDEAFVNFEQELINMGILSNDAQSLMFGDSLNNKSENRFKKMFKKLNFKKFRQN